MADNLKEKTYKIPFSSFQSKKGIPMGYEAAKSIHSFQGSIDLDVGSDELPKCILGNTNISWQDLGKMIKTYRDFNFELNINGSGNTISISSNKPDSQSAANDVITRILDRSQ